MGSVLTPSAHLPLHRYLKWAPFRIDALGLVTFLGADEVNTSVGRLVRSRYLEFLPLLGAFVIASNQFTHRAPGFTLYNITSGIATTDLAGWFTRWIESQKFHQMRNIVTWEISDPRTFHRDTLLAALIGLLATSGLLALSTLMSDWWGLANACAMLCSVGVRHHVLAQNRAGLDAAVTRATDEARRGQSRPVKLFVATSNSKVITMYAPESVVRCCFVRRPVPPSGRLYTLVRHLGWVAFAIHIISIGQADLISQIYTVVLLILPTVLLVYRVGCDDEWLGSRLRAVKSEHVEGTPETTRRMDVYVWLDLDEGEEDSMKRWMLFPHERNTEWWDGYQERKAMWQARGTDQVRSERVGVGGKSRTATEKMVQSILSPV